MKRRLGVSLKADTEWIELEPYGVTTGADQGRPVMLFRSLMNEAVLPVWLSPIDAGIAISQYHVASPALSPHDLTLKVMTELGVKLDRCEFTELKGHHQYVELYFKGHRRFKQLTCRADQAISFCLQAKARFFARREYIKSCREVDTQMARLERSSNSHPYLN